jgi:hypothetical protein
MVETDRPTEEQRLTAVLQEHGAAACPKCGRTIDRGDVSWQGANTQAGTPCTTVYVICQGCDTEVAEVFSWLPWVDHFGDVLDLLEEEDWEGVPIK